MTRTAAQDKAYREAEEHSKAGHLARLRELLSGQPSAELFQRIWIHLGYQEDNQLAIDYANAHLAHWPDQYRILEYMGHTVPPQAVLIRTLDILASGAGPGPDDRWEQTYVHALANAPELAELTEFGMYNNMIGTEGAKAIANSPYLTKLTTLELGHNAIGDEGAIAIANSPNMASLQILGLYLNEIGIEGITALANSPYLANLQYLELNGPSLTEAGLKAIMASPYLSSEVKECQAKLRRRMLSSDWP